MKTRFVAATVAMLLSAVSVFVATSTTAGASADALTCHWSDAQYPHVSWHNERFKSTLDIKTAASGRCDASSEPITVTAQMVIEKSLLGGFLWEGVASGPAITKSLLGGPQEWTANELLAVTPCVPGTYRAMLYREVNGAADAFGDEIISPPKPIECKFRHASMVIDDTGSMGSVIGSVSSSLTSFIQSRPEDEAGRWSLTTFKDSPATVGTTDDRNEALGWVNSLSASGGGDCPEDALGGISSGLSALADDSDAGVEADKQMIVATDASAHGGDVDGIVAAAQASGTRVNVLLTGDCGYATAAAAATASATTAYPYEVSSQVVLRRIAEETGGKYFFIPGGSRADFTAALDAIFAGIANPGVDTQAPTVQVGGVPSMIWSPNHKMVELTPTVTATDDQDPAPVVKVVGVKSSQPDDGQGDGNTSADVQITADGRIFVRAERTATGGARVYTITYRATDQAGNVGFGSATVTVPKDNSGK